MALIPLKQEIIVTPPGSDDPWDPQPSTPYSVKCRLQEGVKLVRNANSQDVVSSAQIYLDKLAEITLSDRIAYVDENGVERTYIPISIEVKRNLGGKPILTVINV
ncbi:hypothetical protein [Paenibacillus sp. YN15]|uniref:hypothetical protein n=1 Tax=Paenibacillus sp. YN15 TaxID=1742774 RepID=UPI000DCB3FA8|nr:hypothetical protein [Paenibacillus sp. YN15]RAU96837.1 hypothetical protein DQG13_19990 [Paenibacillus sp. YN15]